MVAMSETPVSGGFAPWPAAHLKRVSRVGEVAVVVVLLEQIAVDEDRRLHQAQWLVGVVHELRDLTIRAFGEGLVGDIRVGERQANR